MDDKLRATYVEFSALCKRQKISSLDALMKAVIPHSTQTFSSHS